MDFIRFFHFEINMQLPPIGGPAKDATPWNSRSRPKALVSLSRPSKSTKITEVKPTYAPIVNPNTDAYTARE